MIFPANSTSSGSSGIFHAIAMELKEGSLAEAMLSPTPSLEPRGHGHGHGHGGHGGHGWPWMAMAMADPSWGAFFGSNKHDGNDDNQW